MKYKERKIESIVLKASKQFPALIVTGPRQSGKTTLLKHLFSKTHKYVSLDNPDIRILANREPLLFMQNYPPPIIIDEIQYAPKIFSYLKMHIDNNRDKRGQFLLTGSQHFPLMANISDSLAGRIAVFTLLSFSLNEQINLDKTISLDKLKSLILRGGFPEVALNKDFDLNLWFNGYLQTYLERDVRGIKQIGDLLNFQRFLELIAGLDGQIVNFSEISKNIGVAVNTVKAWISVLEASHQIYLVKPFFKNKGKRIIKSPKLYFLDTGLLCFLTGITTTEQIFKGPLAGSMLENLVLCELIRYYYNRGEIPRIYWWRTSNGSEIDFIIEKNGKIFPIEVKLTSRYDTHFLKHINFFKELFNEEIGKSQVVYLSENLIKLEDGTEFIPLYKFLNSL